MKLKFFGDVFCYDGLSVSKDIVNADINFLNLEIPLCDGKTPIKKAGPVLRGNEQNFNSVSKNFKGIKYYNLANNHIGDFANSGIDQTIDILEKQDDTYYGGVSIGNEIKAVQIDDTNVVAISICERQFGISQLNKLGANYFSGKIYKEIIKQKKLGKTVVICTHCAEEMIQWVSPEIRELFKSYIDVGADIVYNTHTHVPAGYERYNDGFILYGMGNFVVNASRRHRAKYAVTSIVYEIDLETMQLTHSWTEVNEDSVVVNCTPIENYIEDCVYPFTSDEELLAVWQEYSVRRYLKDYQYFITPNLIRKVKNFIKFLLTRDKFHLKQKNLMMSYHIWSCISHSLAVETALGVLSEELNDFRNAKSKELMDKYFQ